MPRSCPNPSCSPAPRPNSAPSPTRKSAFIDAGMPGMLPVINAKCVEQAVRTGLGLKAQINLRQHFRPQELFLSRPAPGLSDQPVQEPHRGRGRGHDRSQGRRKPSGWGSSGCIWSRTRAKACTTSIPISSYVDLNRSGIALMEIVTKPHMRTSEEAAAFLRKLRAIVRYLGTCDGNMDEGSMRADVNVSVCRVGGYEKFRETGDFKHLGTRCEIKNVNSMRFIAQAVEYEARRQIEIIEGGGTISQETRLFDAARAKPAPCAPRKRRMTIAISPIPTCCRWNWTRTGWTESKIAARTAGREESPLHGDRACRPMTPRCWSPNASSPTITRMLAKGVDAKSAANWLNNEILGRLNRDGLSIVRSVRSVRPPTTRSSQMIADKTISGKIAKDLLDIVWSEGGDPRASRGGARASSGDRHRRDRCGDRGSDRRQPRQGGRGEGETETRRLVRRSGDESRPAARPIRRRSTPPSRPDSICPKRGDSHKMRKLAEPAPHLLKRNFSSVHRIVEFNP